MTDQHSAPVEFDIRPPAPGSGDEIEAFARLQSRLPTVFRQVFSDPKAPRTVVVVPGLSVDPDVLSRLTGSLHYEERQLAMLMLLRLPNTRIVFVTSTTLEPAIVDYYLNLLPGVSVSHARRRLTLLSACDPSGVSLTRKVLDRPRLLERIRRAVGNPETAHLSCFNVTAWERTLAVRLGILLYGCDPSLQELGCKSGSRRVFREAGIALPAGAEDLRDEQDLAQALAELKRRKPGLMRAAVKLNDAFSGEGNAVFSFGRWPPDLPDAWIREHLPSELRFEAADMSWSHFVSKLATMGGIVEEWIGESSARSPSVQLRITPVGDVELISTHEQILGGPSGQIFQACTFPADPAYAAEIQALSMRVANVMKSRGVLGRFGIDFVSVPQDDGWQHYAIEINLRKGGTTHTFQTLQLLTGGRYDPGLARFETPSGQVRAYYATDNLVNPLYRRLTPEDLVDISVGNALHFDETSQQGVVFSLIGAMSGYGKLGVVAIASDTVEATNLFRRTVTVLDAAAARDRR